MSPARRKPAAELTEATETAEPNAATEAMQGSQPAATQPSAPEATQASQPGEVTESCPWCSANVPVGAQKCPSCGASLRDAVDGEVLGVTQIDPAAVSRASRIRPGRLATWLGADSTDEENELGGHVEPPSKEVREEMLRLELAAIDAEIEAKKNAAEAQRILPDEGAPEPKTS